MSRSAWNVVVNVGLVVVLAGGFVGLMAILAHVVGGSR